MIETVNSPHNSLHAFAAAAWARLAGIAPLYRYGAIVLLVVILAGAYWMFGRSASVSYVTVPLERGTVARAVTATGSINPVLTITVGSYVSGVIQEIDCDFNTKVRKGQLCARIDPRPYQMAVDGNRAAVATARAQVLKDQANLDYARIAQRRYAGLLRDHAASQDSYDSAVNARDQAQAQVALDQATVQQRQAELDAAVVNLGYTNIVAPVDGIVVSRNVTIGQTVAASFQTPTIFLIATDLSKMEVDTNVSESDVGGVRVGDNAQFTVEAFPDRMFNGTVTQVRQAPQTVQNVVTYDVVVLVDNAALLLKPGMTATVRIVTDKRDNVLRVPDQALRYVPGGLSAGQANAAGASQVWSLKNGRPERVGVTTGLDDDTYTEVTSGDLQLGDRVIVSERSTAAARGNGSSPSVRFP